MLENLCNDDRDPEDNAWKNWIYILPSNFVIV